MMLWEMYTWDSVRAYHFDFHQACILEGIDDAQAWKTPDHELKQYLLVARLARNTNTHDSRNTHNPSIPSTEICFKWNSEKDCPSNCKFLQQCTNCSGNHIKRRCPSQSTTSSSNNANATPVGRRQQQPEYALEFFSLIRLSILQTPHQPSQDRYLWRDGSVGWKIIRMGSIKKQSLASSYEEQKLATVGPNKKLLVQFTVSYQRPRYSNGGPQ